MGIIEECAVAVDARIDALVEHMSDSARVERGSKPSAVCVLNAMHRPKDLFNAVENDAITRFLARMICSETAVVDRMPILRGKNKLEVSL